MAGPSTLSLVQACWNADVARHMDLEAGGRFTGFYAAQVRSGAARCYHVFHAARHVGSIVARLEDGLEGLEFVVVAAAGEPGFGFVGAFTAVLEAHARKLGCKTIRAHTVRKGLVKGLRDQSWDETEYVMRKAL